MDTKHVYVTHLPTNFEIYIPDCKRKMIVCLLQYITILYSNKNFKHGALVIRLNRLKWSYANIN